MTAYITAQLIGFLGYLFLITAPNFSNKKQIIKIELVACALLCTQWILLGYSTLIILNILNISVTLITLYFKRNADRIISIFYPLGCLALLAVSTGAILDALCIIAFFGFTRAKISQDMFGFRAFSMMAGFTFMICGICALSVPAAIFNGIFALGHLKSVLNSSEKSALKTQ
ncbi:MAG: YgjV family protein [Alcanivorax sp.]